MQPEVLRMPLSQAEDPIKYNEIMLLDFNRSLEEVCEPVRLNEKFLEQMIGELEEIGPISEGLYYLTFARVTELTLLCAGNYADAFEFSAAGDFLVNPRLILVHIRNRIEPVVKKRHLKLTDQFRNAADSGKDVTRWLKNETLLEIKKEPLLTYLYESLKKLGCMSQEYLSSIDSRMKKIADVIALLSSLHVPKGQNFHQWLQYMPRSERRFIKSSLCQFDTRTFDDLGRDIYQIIQNVEYKSTFLAESYRTGLRRAWDIEDDEKLKSIFGKEEKGQKCPGFRDIA